MTLDLIRSGCYTSAIDQSLKVLLCVVRHTNSARLLLGQLCHRLPCIDNGDIIEELDVAVWVVGLVLEGKEVVVGVAALIKGDGEVDKIEIEVVEAELSQAVIESCWYVLWAVLRVPELGCDKDVFALETGDLATEGLLQSFRDLLLVTIDLRKVEVAVTGLEGFEDGSANLARLSLPGTKAQLAAGMQSVLHDHKGIGKLLTGWCCRCSR